MWKERVVVLFEVVSRHFFGGTAEDFENHQEV
jgi:hypothetical protein